MSLILTFIAGILMGAAVALHPQTRPVPRDHRSVFWLVVVAVVCETVAVVWSLP